MRKCCRFGDYLDHKSNVCTPGYDGVWSPKIFQSKKKTYSATLLPYMVQLENERPTNCSEPKLFLNTNGAGMTLLPNGSLFVTNLHSLFDPEDYCVDRDVALICTPDAKVKKEFSRKLKTEPLRKCCAPNEVYMSENKTCAFVDGVGPMALDAQMFDVIYAFPDCKTPVYAIIGKFDMNNVDNSSTLSYSIAPEHVLTAPQFCVETVMQNGRPEKIDVFTCEEHVRENQMPPTAPDNRFLIYSIGLFISVAFLLATLVVGLLTPSNHHVMHWKCQTNYIICLLIGELLLASTQILSGRLTGAPCSIVAVLMHFAFLAAFFWLNTMCFNIWWTFRDFRPSSMERRQEICRLHLYEIYAWGFPTIIVGVAAILDYTGNENLLRPRFGEKSCWFYGES